MDATATWGVWFAVAYLAGSLPFGLLIGRWQGVDLRKAGSGNLGATNVGRVLGRKWGLICFALDVAKGLGPVLGYGLASGLVGGEADGPLRAMAWLSVAAAAMLGHVFPVWLKFKGGKGVATGLGALLGVWPMLTLPAVVSAVIWLGAVKRTGYVSLASMMAAGSLPVLAVLSGLTFGRPAGEVAVYATVTAALAALVVFRHRSNISRLRAGTETKVGWMSKRR